jgi:hypothetical protein
VITAEKCTARLRLAEFSIGYSSSHGCVRLTNWDADEVAHRISEGTEVSFVDTRSKGMPEVAKK